jgi:lipoyl(octanoyl) transferase
MNIVAPGRLTFADGLALQERLVAQVAAGGDESLMLLEHEPVYTIGRTRDHSSLSGVEPHPVHETNRGGQATYHGPGQLTGYPILDLNKRGRDLHAYLRFLEGFLIDFCAGFGVEASRREGLTGVWVGSRKIASLGVGVRKWVTMHGFAINILRGSVDPFSHITPCGISGVQMTSLEHEAGKPIEFHEALRMAGEQFQQALPMLSQQSRPHKS